MKTDIKEFISMLFWIFVLGLGTLLSLALIYTILVYIGYFLGFSLKGLSFEYYLREINILQRLFVILGAGLPAYFIMKNKIRKLDKKRKK
tara:strand:+ start:907 stop:1176 length:270 start_codon:yes stop_codon:yes gene_type:complete